MTKRFIATLLLPLLLSLGLLFPSAASAACQAGACVTMGPRLASVDSTRGALLNALFGNLLGSNLSVSVADWNGLAQGNVNLGAYLNALQSELNVASPSAALSANATLAQLVSAMAVAAQADGNTATASALTGLQSQVSAVSGTIRLGDLLAVSLPSGALANVQLNALNLVSGMVQLYNHRNVATTPAPVTISGSAIGLGSVVNSVQLYAQVVEPPVYVCGPTGTQLHSAAIRVKLNVDLVDTSPDASALNLLPGVSGASVTIGQVELYVEVARADGVIGTVDALANAVTVQATPGVADVYLGSISDSVFFNRSAVLNAASDLGYATIGTLTVNATTVNIQAKSHARGQAPFASTLVFNGPFPQTRTASTSATFVANLTDALVANLALSLSPSLGLLDATILPTLKTIVGGSLTPTLNTLMTGLVDPLLELLGVRLGEVDVTVLGIALSCSISGTVYGDANHNSRLDGAETGAGATLYAKLVQGAGPASQAVAVNAASGAYSFSGVGAASYSVVIDNNNTLSDVSASAPVGWIGTENPTLTRAVTIANADITGLNFGLFNGSKVSGLVFKDNGSGGGTANNGAPDGGEGGLSGVALKATDTTGGTTYDSASSDAGGAYVLWIPASAGAATLKIVETQPGAYVSTGGSAGTSGGSYDRTADAVSFVNTVGTRYSGVNFADVPDNRFDTDGQQSALPGTVVFYPHNFTAGSGGQVTFGVTGTVASPNVSGWSSVIYRDDNCNGALDAGENPVNAAVVVTADQRICLVVKVFVPVDAPYNAQNTLTLSASFNYTNASPALTAAQARTDLTGVGTQADAGLKLVKSVDKSTAQPGDSITYTITYTNVGSRPLSQLKIQDATPAYTVFNSALCGALPTGITACTVSVQPAAGAAGSITWEFTGSLAAAASGSVTFSVTLQ